MKRRHFLRLAGIGLAAAAFKPWRWPGVIVRAERRSRANHWLGLFPDGLDPRNWSLGRPPASNDKVVVDVDPETTYALTLSGGDFELAELWIYRGNVGVGPRNDARPWPPKLDSTPLITTLGANHEG